MQLDGVCARVDITYQSNTPVRDSKNPSVSEDTTSFCLNDRGKQLLRMIRGERKELISTTLRTFRSPNPEVADNAEAVRQLLIQPGTLATKKDCEKTGFVYAFLDCDLNLVKIGSTIDIAERQKALKKACKITGDLTVIAQSRG
jgi:hypothetical protein